MEELILNDRQKKILQNLIENGSLNIKRLLNDTNTPKSTAYNDIKLLRSLSIEQSYGKVFLAIKNEYVKTHFGSKLWLNREAKEKVAQYITKNVLQDGDSIFLDCGSSTVILSHRIIEDRISSLSIYTNNPNVLEQLYYYTGINKLIVIGGHVDPNNASIYGEFTYRFLNEILDIEYRRLFLGIDSVSLDGTMHIDNIYEVQQKEIMIEKAKKVYVLLDESKIEKMRGRIIGQIDKLISQKGKDSFYCLVGLLNENNPQEDTKRFFKKYKENVILVQ